MFDSVPAGSKIITGMGRQAWTWYYSKPVFIEIFPWCI